MSKLESMFRSQDVFGERVEFTYKGKRSYQTNIGALVSVFVKLIMIFFTIYEFYLIFSRTHPEVAIKQPIKGFAIDPMAETEAWNPMDKGFDIAFKLLIANSASNTLLTEDQLWTPLLSLDPTIAYLTAMQVR